MVISLYLCDADLHRKNNCVITGIKSKRTVFLFHRGLSVLLFLSNEVGKRHLGRQLFLEHLFIKHTGILHAYLSHVVSQESLYLHTRFHEMIQISV